MCSRLIHMHVTWVRLMVLAGAIGTAGCSIALSGGQPPTNGNGTSGHDEDAILVRFRNLADDVVDVEFYFNSRYVKVPAFEGSDDTLARLVECEISSVRVQECGCWSHGY